MRDFLSKIIVHFFSFFRKKDPPKAKRPPSSLLAKTDEQKPPPLVVSASDLGKYCAQIRPTIYSLENEWVKGKQFLRQALTDERLSQLVGDEVLASYEQLIKRDHQGRAFGFRHHNINILVERSEAILSRPQHRFKSTAQKKRGRDNQIVLAGLLTGEAEGQIFLRLDQVLSYRFWGVGYELNDSEASDIMANRLFRQSLKQLAQGLRGLQDIEAISNFDLKDVQAVPDVAGQEFEQLMADILNEHQLTSRKARVLEDFFEKTDLRYKTPSLKRKKGARIQVTSTIDPDYHAEKVAQIKRPKEIVILSPRSLAVAINNNDELAHELDLQEILACLNAATIGTQAIALRLMFWDAIKHKNKSPQGPLPFIPKPIRNLIRSYVHLEAHRSTKALREREKLAGTSKTIYSKKKRWERRKKRQKIGNA
jgi:hypothetical protein